MHIALKKDIYILQQLVSKDFKIKYRRSLLGIVWSVLNPLLMMIVMAIVFSTMFAVARTGSIPNYPLYLILGIVTFQFMSESTSGALTSIVGASSLLKKVRIHRWVFPVQKILFGLVNLSFSLIAVALVMLWFQIIPTWHIVWLPVCLLLLSIFNAGVGLALAAGDVFFRDIQHLWGVFITAWTYATPLFWSFDMIQGMSPTLQLIMKANPMYSFVMFMRDIFLYQQSPSAAVLLACTGWAAAAIVFGMITFKLSEHKFILYI
ncbi:ABC transporter permease [Arcanobacterium hippocoleae]